MSDSLASLRKERYLNLATFRKDGREVAVPVWFALVGNRIVIFTDGTSYKVKRIQRRSDCRVAICNFDGKKILGPWLEGQARIVEDEERERQAYRALRKKYTWQMLGVDVGSFLSRRIKRRKIIEVLLDSEPGPK